MELEYIHNFYYVILIVLVLMVLIILTFNNRDKIYVANKYIFYILFVYSIYYLGSRELSIGVDTMNYMGIFDDFNTGGLPSIKTDVFFFLPFFILSKIVSYRVVLYLCAFAYVFFAARAFRKLSPEYHIYFFLLFMVSPYFFQFGINGMRNGIAASVFLYALSFLKEGKNKVYVYVAVLSIGIHLSMVVPFLIFHLFKKDRNLYILLLIWLAVFSLVLLGMSFNVLGNISDILISNGVMSGYLSDLNEDISKEIRNYWLYGVPVVIWTVFFYEVLRKKKIIDLFYKRCISSYITLSIVYLIFIHASFAVRFAFLSDFLFPLVLFYPLFTLYKKNYNLKVVQLLAICVMIVLLLVKS